MAVVWRFIILNAGDKVVNGRPTKSKKETAMKTTTRILTRGLAFALVLFMLVFVGTSLAVSINFPNMTPKAPSVIGSFNKISTTYTSNSSLDATMQVGSDNNVYLYVWQAGSGKMDIYLWDKTNTRWTFYNALDNLTKGQEQPQSTTNTKYMTWNDYVASSIKTSNGTTVVSDMSVTLTASAVKVMAGDTVQIFATVTGGTAPYTYAWETSGGSGSSTTNRIDVSWATAGTKMVKCTVTDHSATAKTVQASIFITVLTPLKITVSGPVQGAVNGTYTFDAAVTGGETPYAYSWNIGGTGSSADKSWSTPGTYTVSCIVTDIDGTTATDSTTITIYSLPTISVTGSSDGKLNTGYTFTATVSGGLSPYTCSWTTSGGSGSSSSSSINISWSATGLKTVSCTVTDTLGSTASGSATITIWSAPTLILSGPTEGIENTNYTFSVAVSGGKPTYQYYWNGVAGGTTTTFSSPTSGAFSISCRVIDDLGQIADGTIGIRIYDPPSITISGPSEGILNTNYSFLATVNGGKTNYSYVWTNATGSTSSAIGNWNTSGTKTVSCKVMDALGQTATGTKNIVIYAPVTLTITPTTATVLTSQDAVFTVTASGGKSPYISYNWTNAIVKDPMQPNVATANFAYPNTGNHIISCIVTDSISQTATATATLTVNPRTYMLTTNINPVSGGTITRSPNAATYTEQTSVQLTATPSVGYQFDDWSGNLSGTTNPQSLLMDGDKNVTANFKMIQFTLTYLAGAGGTIFGVTPQTVNYGDSGTAVTVVPNAGYHFVSWSDGRTDNPRTDTNVIMSKTVTASCAINTYTITSTAGANGTITPLGATTVNYGASQSYTITPNAHYHVATVKVDGTLIGNPTSYQFTNVSASHTIDVTFAVDTFTITSTAGANGTITPFGTTTMNYGASQSYTLSPSTGYHVSVLAVDGSSVAIANPYVFSNVSASHTIDVTFAINTYTLTYTAGTGGTISGTTPQTVNYGGNGMTVTAVPNAGYTFTGWSDGKMTASRQETNVTANLDVTANFTSGGGTTYTLGIRIYPSGNIGSVSRIPAGTYYTSSGGYNYYTYNSGTNVTLTANPSSGYVFSSWGDDLSGSLNSNSITINGNSLVTANFTKSGGTTYTLGIKIYPSETGTVSMSPAGTYYTSSGGYDYYTYNSGTNVTLTANPGSGYVFSSWSDNLSGSTNPNSITINGNSLVTANFTSSGGGTTYTLTMAVSDGGHGSTTSPSVGSYSGYSSGTVVTITATPSTGCTFTGWSGDASGMKNPTTVTMSSDKSVTANFSYTAPANNHTVTVYASPSSGGAVMGGGTYAPGATVTIGVSSYSPGYYLSSWTCSSGGIAGSGSTGENIPFYQFTMPDNDVTMVGNFTGEDLRVDISGTQLPACLEGTSYSASVTGFQRGDPLTDNCSFSWSLVAPENTNTGAGTRCLIVTWTRVGYGTISCTAKLSATGKTGTSNTINLHVVSNMTVTISGQTSPYSSIQYTYYCTASAAVDDKGPPSFSPPFEHVTHMSENCWQATYTVTWGAAPNDTTVSCTVRDSSGADDKTGYLGVQIQPLSLSASMSITPASSMIKGNHATFTCWVSAGKSPFSYTWTITGIDASIVSYPSADQVNVAAGSTTGTFSLGCAVYDTYGNYGYKQIDITVTN
jgi:uncharacterized repeat protein (TIGR02543 family)